MGFTVQKTWVHALIIKIAIICLLPYYIVLARNETSVHAIVYHIGWFYGMESKIAFQWMILFMALTFAPSILFNYVNSNRSLDDSITKHFVAAFILGNTFVQVMMVMPMMFLLMNTGNYQEYIQISNAALSAIFASKWAFLILVAIPFIMREVRRLEGSDRDNESHMDVPFIGKVSRYGIWGASLVITLYVLPVFVIGETWNHPVNTFSDKVFLTGMAVIVVSTRDWDSTFRFMTFAEVYYLLIPVVSFLTIYYIKALMRYLQGKTSFTNCIAWGLGGIAAGSVLFLFFPVTGETVLSIPTPIPVTFVTGLIAMKLLPRIEVAERIWDDEGEQPLSGLEEKPSWYQGEQTVKVPITSILRSKVTRRQKQVESFDWDRKDEDVFQDS